MDYKQPSKQNGNFDFFTVGAGTNNPELNSSEAENNLDLSNAKANWQNAPLDNKQGIGNKVVNLSERPNATPIGSETLAKLGQIVELEPPKMESVPQLSTESAPSSLYDKKAIKTGDSLSKEGIQEMDRVVKEFERNGNAADFYDIARDMTETHLDNSYNRILGEGTTTSTSKPHNRGPVA